MAITGSTDRADTGAAPPTRRTFTRGAAWSIPVIATATAAPPMLPTLAARAMGRHGIKRAVWRTRCGHRTREEAR